MLAANVESAVIKFVEIIVNPKASSILTTPIENDLFLPVLIRLLYQKKRYNKELFSDIFMIS